MDYTSRGRFDFRSRFPHYPAHDSLDLLTHGIGGAGEELPVELLHLGSALGTLCQNLFSRSQSFVKCDYQRVFAED
jgi:hypothetical protein